MATEYSDIYDRFLSKITDYELDDLVDSAIYDNLLKYMKSSLSDFKYCTQDLSNRDDGNSIFNITLTDLEQEIIARFMIVQWLNPFILRTENLTNYFNSKDFQGFSPANIVDKLSKLKKDLINEVVADMVFYYYS